MIGARIELDSASGGWYNPYIMTDDVLLEPFSISPNPLWLYQTPSIKAALHKIRYTLTRRQGLTCILGGVGVGKSSILRYAYTEFDAREDTIAKIIPQPNFATEFAFLKAVSTEFGLPVKRSLLDQENAYKEFLIEQHVAGKNVVLFIDEAQGLSNKMLEIIRAMLNFETNRAKLVQIVICGQLELRDRLLRDDMEAIASRVIMPTILNALTPAETREVIDFRCRTFEIPNPFDRSAVDLIYQMTGGVPREVLKLCAAAFEFMEITGSTKVDASLVELARSDATLVKSKAARDGE